MVIKDSPVLDYKWLKAEEDYIRRVHPIIGGVFVFLRDCIDRYYIGLLPKIVWVDGVGRPHGRFREICGLGRLRSRLTYGSRYPWSTWVMRVRGIGDAKDEEG